MSISEAANPGVISFFSHEAGTDRSYHPPGVAAPEDYKYGHWRVMSGQRPVVYGDGKQTRAYIYVSDVADAFLAAAVTTQPGTWNIGTGAETSVLDIIGLIGQVAGHEAEPEFAPPRPGELQRSALDATRAARDLGWKATTPLREGIAAVYHWVQRDFAKAPHKKTWHEAKRSKPQ